MANNHRIKIKLPDGSEFEAEGSPDDVKAQYDAFLDLMRATPKAPSADKKLGAGGGSIATGGGGGAPDDALMTRIFDRAEDGLISLKVLPPGENRQADGLLLLLYGYKRLAGTENVFAVTLSRAAKKSGILIDRTDRAMEPHKAYYGRGGVRRSATYTLNNQGVAFAERLAMQLLE
jgi:hypothetical protein